MKEFDLLSAEMAMHYAAMPDTQADLAAKEDKWQGFTGADAPTPSEITMAWYDTVITLLGEEEAEHIKDTAVTLMAALVAYRQGERPALTSDQAEKLATSVANKGAFANVRI